MNPLTKVIRRAFSSTLYGDAFRLRPCLSVVTGHMQGPSGERRHEETQMEKSSVPLPSISDIAKHFVGDKLDSIHINILDNEPSSEKIVFDALKNNSGLIQVGGMFPIALASDFLRAGAKRVVINSLLNSDGEIDWCALNELRDKLGKDCIALGFSTRLDEDAYYIYDSESNRKYSLPLDQRILSALAPYCSHFAINLQPPKKDVQDVQLLLRFCTHLEYESPIPVEISGWLPSLKDAEKSTGPGTVYKKVSIQIPADSSLWTKNLADFPKVKNQERMSAKPNTTSASQHSSQSSSSSSYSPSSSPTMYMGSRSALAMNAGPAVMAMSVSQRAMSTASTHIGTRAFSGTGSTTTSGRGSSGTSASGLDYGSSSGMASQEFTENKEPQKSTTGSDEEAMRHASQAPTSGESEVPPSDAERTQTGGMGAQPQKSDVDMEHGETKTQEQASEQAAHEESISAVEHDTHAERFVSTLHTASGRTVIAELTYKKISTHPLIYEFDHTYTPSEMRGKGVAEKLANAAFEHVRSEGGKVLPTCEYIANTYLKRHPQWDEHVTKV